MGMAVVDIARVAHEANRAIQQVHQDPTIPISPSWDDADDETRALAIVGVEGVLAGNTPEQSHEAWVAFKREAGWTHGEVKDPEAKTHPLLVAYADLPEHQKVKDRLFVEIVRVLADPTDMAHRRIGAEAAS